MIFHIRQCKLCPKNRVKCAYLNKLRNDSKIKALNKVHVIHNCEEYKALFKKGDRVEFNVYEQMSEIDGSGYRHEIWWDQHEDNPFLGTIEKYCPKSSTFAIKPDKEFSYFRLKGKRFVVKKYKDVKDNQSEFYYATPKRIRLIKEK